MWMPTKMLLVMAHPDDEVIFGWPAFQGGIAGLLVCSSDLNNPDRQWCRHRKQVTAALCGERGIPFKCLDYPSEFYRLETREGTLSRLLSDVSREMAGFDHSTVYTHNPLGEYGHLDHILVNQAVVMSSQKPVLWSNMFVASNWVPWSRPSRVASSMMFKNRLAECRLDEEFYAKCEAKYREAGVWTWSKPPIKMCEVFSNG